jgi:hypothetical protein
MGINKQGVIMQNIIKISIESGDITKFTADVVALKFAQSFYGADYAIAQILGKTQKEIEDVLPNIGDYCVFPSQAKILAKNVLFISVKDLRFFEYGEIQKFAFDVLKRLSEALPETKHLALTIHGVGYGLDESESFRSEMTGLIEAVQQNFFPPQLEKISIVERDYGRSQRLEKLLIEILPAKELSTPSLKEITRQTTEISHSTINKRHIFVAMPFSNEMEDLFLFGIQDPVHTAGYLCERVDITNFTGDIMERVKSRIETSDYVIAEVTNGNPNVFLELGYAWGKNRPTIIISRDTGKLPFDIRGQRCLAYTNINDLQKSLTRELLALDGDPESLQIPKGMLDNSLVLTKELQKILENEYQLNWNGIHGFPHWVRVRENGLRLAKINGANSDVVELFAFIHDICRRRDGTDPDHGKRAAEFINSLEAKIINLSESELDSLKFACAYHDQGMVQGNITIQTCWDADRLDLGRVGTVPDPRYLCTSAAKQPEIIEWALRRSQSA